MKRQRQREAGLFRRLLPAAAALGLGARALGCSVELAPLASAELDAGSEACTSCTDAADATASDAQSCAAGQRRWSNGSCCNPQLSLDFAGASSAGLMRRGGEALVFGQKNARAWVARVDRCSGQLLGEAEVTTDGDSEALTATLAGGQLVLGGVNGSRSLLAWADAATLGGFKTLLGSSSPSTRINALADAGASQVWGAGTLRPSTIQSNAVLSRFPLDGAGPCSDGFGNEPGSGQTLHVEGTNVVVASIEGLSLWLTRTSTSSCFVGDCGCSWGPRERIDYDPTYDVGALLRAPGGFWLTTTWLESVLSAKAGGGAVLRVNESLQLDALFQWNPTSLLDRLGPLLPVDDLLVAGGGRDCADTTCQAGVLLGLSSSLGSGALPKWERQLSDVRLVTGLALEPEAEAGLLVAGAGASGAKLVRCSRDGTCPAP